MPCEAEFALGGFPHAPKVSKIIVEMACVGGLVLSS